MAIKIKKILVPVDFTETAETAIAKAIELVKSLKAELFLLHVVEFKGYDFSIVPETGIKFPPIREIEKILAGKMDAMQAGIRKKHGITPEVYVTTGNIDSEIIDFSKKKKIDLIVMGTHGASGYRELFIGSNAQRVVTLSDIPVLTMQKHSHKPGFKNILLPIDNSLHSREKVNIAMTIADLFGSKIHVIGLPNSKDKKEIELFKIKTGSVGKVIKSHNLPYTTTIIKGNGIADAAMEYANKKKCDLIVINTGHESKLTGIFLGAFAQQIVNHSKVPVLSFKHISGNYTIETPGYGV
jgi:nucleotide-binding universal stress UspA family protein